MTSRLNFKSANGFTNKPGHRSDAAAVIDIGRLRIEFNHKHKVQSVFIRETSSIAGDRHHWFGYQDGINECSNVQQQVPTSAIRRNYVCTAAAGCC